jgi:23S rRNA (uracil1939-C5)-methyltransferase
VVRKKKELPLLEAIEITGVAAEGKALARVNDMVVFVPYVVPGDIVDLQLTRKKNRYAEAKAVRFIKYSEVRAVPFCSHFGICGGCKWQQLPYEEQLKYKQQQVVDNLERIGKVELPEISPILGSKKTQFYRNKLEFTFSNKRWLTAEELQSEEVFEQRNALGFHIPGSFDKVLDIDKCWLQDDISNKIRNAVRQYALDHHIEFFDLRAQSGLLRNMIIRTASTGELMVILIAQVAKPEQQDTLNEVLQFIGDSFPEITSLIYVINNKCNDSIGDLNPKVFKGKDHIIEEMEGLNFKVGPKSFYQTNSEQAYNLYKVVRDFAGLTGNELVYDLYTGTGTIANFVAKRSKQVIGIEYVEEAIEDAKVNAGLNKLENTLFFAGDMKDILTQDFINQYGRPDVVITDPPRAGMHPDVIDTILFASPERIVYVSCNPTTQARDLQLLDSKYKVMAVQPVDMFPHTQHVENVVLLELRK